jgi:hypothetical protein
MSNSISMRDVVYDIGYALQVNFKRTLPAESYPSARKSLHMDFIYKFHKLGTIDIIIAVGLMYMKNDLLCR